MLFSFALVFHVLDEIALLTLIGIDGVAGWMFVIGIRVAMLLVSSPEGSMACSTAFSPHEPLPRLQQLLALPMIGSMRRRPCPGGLQGLGEKPCLIIDKIWDGWDIVRLGSFCRLSSCL